MKIRIYGRPDCPYCVKAKELCVDKGLEFEYIDIKEQGISKEQLGGICGKVIETVPQIFVDDNHVGGFTDLEAFLSTESAPMSFDIEL